MIKNKIYLSAALEYYKYMKNPLALFPKWTIEQYKFDWHALNRYVHLELQQAVLGLPQAQILANKQLRHKLPPLDIMIPNYSGTMVP
jgi:hypothetical protein